MEPQYFTLLYSKYSPACKRFFDFIQSSGVDLSNILRNVCIDNKKIRERIQKDNKLDIKVVPCILAVYGNGVVEKYEANGALNWLENILSLLQPPPPPPSPAPVYTQATPTFVQQPPVELTEVNEGQEMDDSALYENPAYDTPPLENNRKNRGPPRNELEERYRLRSDPDPNGGYQDMQDERDALAEENKKSPLKPSSGNVDPFVANMRRGRIDGVLYPPPPENKKNNNEPELKRHSRRVEEEDTPGYTPEDNANSSPLQQSEFEPEQPQAQPPTKKKPPRRPAKQLPQLPQQKRYLRSSQPVITNIDDLPDVNELDNATNIENDPVYARHKNPQQPKRIKQGDTGEYIEGDDLYAGDPVDNHREPASTIRTNTKKAVVDPKNTMAKAKAMAQNREQIDSTHPQSNRPMDARRP